MTDAPVLVIAAHPDDEVLGCGGTMARLAASGHGVHVAILGEGITSRHDQRADADPALLARLRESSHRAGAILGARSVQTFGLPDNRFDSVDLLDVVKIIERLVQDIAPRTVYTQHGGDLNVDHQVVFRATLTATRPVGGSPVQAVYAYEVPSSTEWAFQRFAPAFRPNVFVDIASTVSKKVEALGCYDGEMRAFPHPRSAEALHAIAKRWGAVAGVRAAEAFELVREVR